MKQIAREFPLSATSLSILGKMRSCLVKVSRSIGRACTTHERSTGAHLLLKERRKKCRAMRLKHSQRPGARPLLSRVEVNIQLGSGATSLLEKANHQSAS